MLKRFPEFMQVELTKAKWSKIAKKAGKPLYHYDMVATTVVVTVECFYVAIYYSMLFLADFTATTNLEITQECIYQQA